MSEYKLAEKPTLDTLQALGYTYLPPSAHAAHRDGENHVLLRAEFVQAVQRINGVSEDVARQVYSEVVGKSDNEEWLSLLRGNYSKTVPGEAKKKTIRLIDFRTLGNNTYTVTNQLKVRAEKTRIADVVVYVNGIPLVVIEAKSPLAPGDKTGQAFDQIKQYEQQVPRLFYSNAFNVVTNGVTTLYGATGASSEHWSEWKDPWPRKAAEFPSALDAALYALLNPERLLDIIAHFTVFERRNEKVIKKVCRYQQFRAVNKIIQRVVAEEHRRGLIWHTQGSGKSLTMVFAALKLKTHRTLESPALASPNLLVLTDRIDLDDQIARTFEACGLPNPVQVKDGDDLQARIHSGSAGQTMLSTIFKFQGSKTPVPDSANWILLVDECHRTQEKDLGTYLRATFPQARFFGFTGTPIKKNDKDTYQNFGAPGEGYLDRYSIDDAVRDGATVPIFYTARKTEWAVDTTKIDILFDQWFSDEPEDVQAAIKKRGVSVADLARHPRRIDLIATDIWAHFRAHAQPDGLKAQIVAIDREALILYKRALDRAIAKTLMAKGMDPDEARAHAAGMSACVYSKGQEDEKPSEDPYTESIRADLRRLYLDRDAEKTVKDRFISATDPLSFLIVCNKLLTGFDAPVEAVMYLDSPLTDHSLLQAIARTNRVYAGKQNGLIVDYIGISRKLDDALASYRADDVQNAMRDANALLSELRTAHAGVMALTRGIKRNTQNLKAEYDALIQVLGTEEHWFTFRRKAREFVAAYTALTPDPETLQFQTDLKWVVGFIHYAAVVFDKDEGPSLGDYSAKIREMLRDELEVTGIRTLTKLRNLTDPKFWEDFQPGNAAGDLKMAAIRKSAELKKITTDKAAENPAQYGPFSARVLEAIHKFEQQQIDALELLRTMEEVAHDLQAEESAHHATGLSARAYGIYKILLAGFPTPEPGAAAPHGASNGAGQRGAHASPAPDPAQQVAVEIDQVYASDQSAPPGWHLKEQLRKELRQQVKRVLIPAGFSWKEIPGQVEEYALKTYLKG
ncbi:type I restriction endonuclease subunit R [Longimicrobium sp.]|uniref:type I restriction endonuclease subunit R n=1 Tax=Longimicrobium sp. TaxID=2029185 RepID=UPI003B3B269C